MSETGSERLGWLGTGRMGVAMVERLLAGQSDVTVWNRTRAKCEPLEANGAEVADSISELASADVVFVMVSTSADLLQVTTGEGGLLRSDNLPSVIIDCSTVSAEASATVRAEADALGVQFLAAPISGNPHMVTDGGAAIVASGPADTFARVRPYLQLIAPTVVHAGPAEESRLVKLCHNLLLGMITQALVEVTALAEKGGVENRAFIDFINGSVLGSTFIRHKGQAIVDRNYTPTFNQKMLRKDYDLGLGAARNLEVPMPVAAVVHHLIQTAIGHGLGEQDYVSLYEVEARAAGLTRPEEQ
ncbi:MAG: hypothetical protein QOH56_1947 [Pseudonocardiales bacterium]|jgi:3-hydroxyisobutyrate dehydrogenase-like beta-hydroxyacid dehydrogenase|nr:hypothetical protein [Pseudonocardiales bacterium]